MESAKLADILKSKKLCIGGPLAHQVVDFCGLRMIVADRPPFDQFRQTDLVDIKGTRIEYILQKWKCGHMLFEFYVMRDMTEEEIMTELICHYIKVK
jgi:hypothetical protein